MQRLEYPQYDDSDTNAMFLDQHYDACVNEDPLALAAEDAYANMDREDASVYSFYPEEFRVYLLRLVKALGLDLDTDDYGQPIAVEPFIDTYVDGNGFYDGFDEVPTDSDGNILH